MISKEWFLDYFNDDYAKLILDPITPEFTEIQVDLIENLLLLSQTDRILDACAGKGRHAISLAKKGYSLTAIDFVSSYVKHIETVSLKENLNIQTLTMDIRLLSHENFFNKVYLMFTSFGYFTDGENEVLLKNLKRSLKKDGLLLVDIENRDYILKNFIYEKWREKEFGLLLERHKFFPESSRQTTKRVQYYHNGTIKESFRELRLYSVHELIQLAKLAGFNVINLVGDYSGKPFQINSPRIIVVLRAV